MEITHADINTLLSLVGVALVPSVAVLFRAVSDLRNRQATHNERLLVAEDNRKENRLWQQMILDRMDFAARQTSEMNAKVEVLLDRTSIKGADSTPLNNEGDLHFR